MQMRLTNVFRLIERSKVDFGKLVPNVRFILVTEHQNLKAISSLLSLILALKTYSPQLNSPFLFRIFKQISITSLVKDIKLRFWSKIFSI